MERARAPAPANGGATDRFARLVGAYGGGDDASDDDDGIVVEDVSATPPPPSSEDTPSDAAAAPAAAPTKKARSKKAPKPAPRMLRLVVPAGALQGDMLSFEVGGRDDSGLMKKVKVQVKVPAGKKPGDAFEAPMPGTETSDENDDDEAEQEDDEDGDEDDDDGEILVEEVAPRSRDGEAPPGKRLDDIDE